MKKSKSVPLFNFAHGYVTPAEFRYGPFKIKISESDVKAVDKLSRHNKTELSIDPKSAPILKKSRAKAGRVVKTATAFLVDSSSSASQLFVDIPNSDSFSDLTAVLSFLTGRQVFVKEQLSGFEPPTFGERVVAGNYFHHSHKWPDVVAIKNSGLAPAFWALIKSNSIDDLLGMMCYSSAALDSIVTYWFKVTDAGATLGYGSDHSMRNKQARERFEAFSRDELEASPLVNDVVSRIGNLFSPSALVKTRAFLVAQGYFSNQPTDGELDRLKLLNKTRNRVVHSADIPSEIHEDFQRRGEIAATVAVIAREISLIYISELAGISDMQIEVSKSDITEYFKSGTFRKHKVFEESYEMFVTRMESNWIGGNGN